MKNKDIDTKILFKFIKKNNRLHPVYESWRELSRILFAVYRAAKTYNSKFLIIFPNILEDL